MNTEDVEIGKLVRHEFSRRPVDITRVDIQVTNGRVVFGGVLLTLRDRPDVNLESELELIMKQLMRVRRIKEVTSNMRLMEKDNSKEEVSARGRTRGAH